VIILTALKPIGTSLEPTPKAFFIKLPINVFGARFFIKTNSPSIGRNEHPVKLYRK
jgi:hypothetical protein